jgi:hypothetical protein
MKKLIVAAALALTASSAYAALANSSHNLPGKTISGTTLTAGASCAYCHMPHGGASIAGAPLWSRNLITGGGVYTFYTAATQGAGGGQATPTQLRVPSQLCLSCHDGTQSVARVTKNGGGNKYLGGVTLDTNARISNANTLIGPNLSSDHPVSVTFVLSSTYAGLAASVPAPFAVFTAAGAMASGAVTGTVECTSCHDAHASIGNSTAYPLRSIMLANGGVDYCSGCHSTK